MADPDQYLLRLPHRPGLEDLPELSVATESLAPPQAAFHLAPEREENSPSVRSRSVSVSASSYVSEVEDAASPVGSSRWGTPRSMSPSAKRKSEPESVPVTYTPTTHRISKAKKGKKVHVCEYGCGKIFTRAEHRKRHEANHRKDPLYKCTVPGCEKPFQRIDLLNRHLERQHGIQNPSPSTSTPRRQASGGATGATGVPQSSQHPVINQQLHSQSPPTMNISQAESYGRQYAITPRSHMPMDQRSTMTTTGASQSMAPSYTVPHPTGDQPQFYSPEMGYEAAASTQTYWGYPSSMVYASPTETVPTSAEPGASNYLHYQPEFGLDARADGSFAAPNLVGAGSSSFSPLDPGAGADDQLRHQPTMAANELVNVNSETTRHYEHCFWTCVDGAFQVLHPSLAGAIRDQFLRDIVWALGAQLSAQPGAKLHSRAFAERAKAQYHQLPPKTFFHQSSLSTLQAVFLFEYFQLYRSTGSGVQKSLQFAALYNELQQAFNTLQYDSGLEQNHERWIDVESRHRLLAACFVLDTHRQQLFHQTPIQAYPPAQVPPIPRPCALQLWTAKEAGEWYAVKTHRQPTLGPCPLFTTQLEHAVSLQMHGTISPSTHADPVAATVQLATLVPVRSLLITASSSWLFAQKTEEGAWRDAMREMREWATEGADAPIAAWLAGKMLRAHFFPEVGAMTSGTSTVSLETDWCLYLCGLVLWAYTFPIGEGPPQARAPRRSSTYSSGTPQPQPPQLQRAETQPAAAVSGYMSPPPSDLSSTGPPTSHVRGTSSTGRAAARGSRGSLQPLAPGPQPPPPSPLRLFLDSLATHQWTEVQPLRGHSGADCVLEAVAQAISVETERAEGSTGIQTGKGRVQTTPAPAKSDGKGKGKGKAKAKEIKNEDSEGATQAGTATLGRARIVEERGALIGEAVGVLNRLRAGRGIWF